MTTEIDAARLLLDRLGINPADLLSTGPVQPAAPTLAEYLPTAVASGARTNYWPYWPNRPLDQITATDIGALTEHIRATALPRRNTRDGRSAAEHTIAALRCLFRHPTPCYHACAAKPPAAAAEHSPSDHTTSTPTDASSDYARKAAPSAGNRSPPSSCATCSSITRPGTHPPGSPPNRSPPTGYATPPSPGVERHYGHAIARTFAGHATPHNPTDTYTRATLTEIATALSALTREPHPLL